MGFGMMLLITLGIIFGYVALMTWPLHKVAVWMEAGRSGYWHCVLALFATGAASAATGVAGAALADTVPLPVSAVAGFVLQLFVFAWVLQTTMVRAFVIGILYFVAVVVLFIVLALGFGGLGAIVGGVGSLFGGGSPSVTSFEPSSPVVSQEVMEDGTVVTTYEDGSVSTERTTTGSGGTSSSTTFSSGSPVSGAGASISTPAAQPPPAPAVQKRFAFQDSDFDFLPSRVGARVRIETHDGRTHEGSVLRVTGNTVLLRKRVGGGTMEFGVNKSDAKRVQIYEELQ